ncbi:ExbD/TolR family protein [Methylibium rhizosphaerae]|jgi:biopolymer transport protein ExbD|uniref:ExbD/TolR family protein n=1 Tax=Methylibium rhizosphaerae TaxID=2570323 RepID=UPI0015E39D09|nr:biopolymer transporter ExbD [Methylibium rhizosphaerae]
MSIVLGKRRKAHKENKGDSAGMMLTSLMDIFIVLVLYLLVNQGTGVELDPPENVILPISGVDTAPRQSVVVVLSDRDVRVQGQSVVSMAEVVASDELEIAPIRQAIERIKAEAEQRADQNGMHTEVTIVADQFVPFKVLKKVMLSSSNAGFGKISFAVNQM